MKFVIVHYNTPELTACLCGSILKNHSDAEIIIFDNSDKKPFLKDAIDVVYYDNTQGGIINFNKELAKYPNKVESSRRINNYGSAKHSMTVDWLCKHIKDSFVLLDSDVLLKKPVDFIDETKICVGDIKIYRYPNKPYCDGPMKTRILPFITYINTKLMNKKNINYFDWKRMDGLTYEGHCNDTGTSFYEDIMAMDKTLFKKIDLNEYVIHYGRGSYTSQEPQKKWLQEHSNLWT